MDRIVLEGIHFDIRVGTTEEERSRPQPCRLDVVLRSSLLLAGETGNLQDSIDYAAVFAAMERTCTTKTFQLLEEVAHQVCEEILALFPVRSVGFQIRKLHPFSDKLNSVGIEIRRARKKPTHTSADSK